MSKSCYFEALHGCIPTEEECMELGGCECCPFCLDDPPKPENDNEQDVLPF